MTDQFDISFEYEGKRMHGVAVPDASSIKDGVPRKFDVMLDNEKGFTEIECTAEGWKMNDELFPNHDLAAAIGEYIFKYYE